MASLNFSCVLLLCMIAIVPIAQATITCTQISNNVMPCVTYLMSMAKGLETSTAWPRPHLIAKPLATVLKPQLVKFLDSTLLWLLTSQKIVESIVLTRSAPPPTVQSKPSISFKLLHINFLT